MKFQESYITPLENTPGNPLSQLWKDSFKACWYRLRGVFQICVETTLEKLRFEKSEITHLRNAVIGCYNL